jgi:hypothetical protein
VNIVHPKGSVKTKEVSINSVKYDSLPSLVYDNINNSEVLSDHISTNKDKAMHVSKSDSSIKLSSNNSASNVQLSSVENHSELGADNQKAFGNEEVSAMVEVEAKHHVTPSASNTSLDQDEKANDITSISNSHQSNAVKHDSALSDDVSNANSVFDTL